jgi:hypothetical protein
MVPAYAIVSVHAPACFLLGTGNIRALSLTLHPAISYAV